MARRPREHERPEIFGLRIELRLREHKRLEHFAQNLAFQPQKPARQVTFECNLALQLGEQPEDSAQNLTLRKRNLEQAEASALSMARRPREHELSLRTKACRFECECMSKSMALLSRQSHERPHLRVCSLAKNNCLHHTLNSVIL